MKRAITAEVGKAETRIRRIEDAWEVSRITHNARWAEKRLAAIAEQPPDVRAALLACKVISEEDVLEADRGGE